MDKTPGPAAAGLLIVNGPFRLVGRNDGSIALEADVPGDGKGSSRIEIPASYAAAFLTFMGAASSAGRTLLPPPAIA
jgi:hypothetical protein